MDQEGEENMYGPANRGAFGLSASGERGLPTSPVDHREHDTVRLVEIEAIGRCAYRLGSEVKRLDDKMLRQDLCRLIGPLSPVDISHIVELVELDPAIVKKKLSQVHAQFFEGSSCEQVAVLVVDDSRQDDHEDVGSEDGVRATLGTSVKVKTEKFKTECSPYKFRRYENLSLQVTH